MKTVIPQHGDSPCLEIRFLEILFPHPTAEPLARAVHAFNSRCDVLSLKLIQRAFAMRENVHSARVAFVHVKNKIGDDVIFGEGGLE